MSMLTATNAIKRDSCIISFFMDLKGIKDETNLNAVIEIQNIELYFKDYVFVTTSLSTAYDDIQFANPNYIPM